MALVQFPSTCLTNPESYVYAIVRNIPDSYHAKHLRSFFCEFVENNRFRCFHYRHRPEIQHASADKPSTSTRRFCCVVVFDNEKYRQTFVENYHKKFWIDTTSDSFIPLKCFIFPVKLGEASEGDNNILTLSDLNSLVELHPPSIMPFGNVGTPSEFFLEQIRLCKLPSSVIPKLGLKPRRRVRMYGAVPLHYFGNAKCSTPSKQSKSSYSAISSKQKQLRVCDVNVSNIENNIDVNTDSQSASINKHDDDEEDEEDWERHEALHEDVTEQDRIKPKKYEEEQEVTWEKGGPGLVWYTDTFYWNEKEEGTDCDWKWADDWDVDYSIYFNRNDGDLDARQAVEIIEDKKLRCGEVSMSVFKKKEKDRKRRRHNSDTEIISNHEFGAFERHTKGIGSKILKTYGWKPGTGLGAKCSGRSDSIHIELEEIGGSQLSGERIGLGYHGDKLQRTNFTRHEEHLIGTKYDQKPKSNVDNDTIILRRQESTVMKYRC